MQNYELTYLITPDLDEKAAGEMQEKINNLLGASIIPVVFKKIKLAYLINKKIDAFLVSVNFSGEPTKVPEISKEIDKIPEIIRFLLIRKEIEKPKKEKKKKIESMEKLEVDKKEKPKKTTKQKITDMDALEKDLEKILES